MLRRIVRRLLGRHLLAPPPRASEHVYWSWRARAFGPRAVVNIAHTPDELEDVTDLQRRYLLPLLQRQLTGRERRTLDYGCGPGRFSVAVAESVGGSVVATDPIRAFLDTAPQDPRVEYVLLPPHGHPIALADDSVDVVWICLVPGAIRDSSLPLVIDEVERVLRPGGLLFVVENTADKPDGPHFWFRSVAAYCALFPGVALEQVGEYEDVGETISVLSGRATPV